jgi:hypothetical protein
MKPQLYSGMSHPLSVFEVFLGTRVLKIVSLLVRIVALLVMVQSVFAVLAFKHKWWSKW